MSNKWLKREGPVWVEKRIITQEQYEEICRLYPDSPGRVMQMLPIFASVLLGLSLLTFVASNWDGIPALARLVILAVTMIGFYASGFTIERKGHPWIGQGVLGLGVISFGAGMILIGQTFHLIPYDARVFVLWSLAGLALLVLYRGFFFFILTSVLIFAGQVYSLISFNEVSLLLFLLTVLGLGGFAMDDKRHLTGWILSFLTGFQAMMWIINEEIAWSWIVIVAIALYGIGLWLGSRPIAQGFLALPPAFGFFFATVMVFIHEYVFEEEEFLAAPLPFLTIFVLLWGFAFWKTAGEKGKQLPLILFLPLFYLPDAGIVYLALMFVYAGLLIYFGDQEQDSWKSNCGVFLFMFSSFIGYIQLAWDFLDKSLFFLLGGLLLFAIHWTLRRRSRWTAKGGKRP